MGEINHGDLSEVQNPQNPARQLQKPEIELGGYRSASTSHNTVFAPQRLKKEISSGATPIARKILKEYPDVREPVRDHSPRNIVRYLCALEDWSLDHNNIGRSQKGIIYDPNYIFSTHKGADASYACFFASLTHSYSIGFRIVCFYDDPKDPQNYVTEVEVPRQIIESFEKHRNEFCREHGVTTAYGTSDGNYSDAPLIPEHSNDQSVEYTEKDGRFYVPMGRDCNIPGKYNNWKDGCETSPREHNFCNGGGVVLRAKGRLL